MTNSRASILTVPGASFLTLGSMCSLKSILFSDTYITTTKQKPKSYDSYNLTNYFVGGGGFSTPLNNLEAGLLRFLKKRSNISALNGYCFAKIHLVSMEKICSEVL